MKKIFFAAAAFAVLAAFCGCASAPSGESGNADSPAALLGVSLEGNADEYPQEQAAATARTVLAKESSLIFADAAEVKRVSQKAAEKARKKAASKARSARFDNFFDFVLGSKSALDAVADGISFGSGSDSSIESISAQSEFEKALYKALEKDSMTKCRSFVYVTISAGILEKDGLVKPCARTVIRLKNKSGKNVHSVMAVCGAPAVSAEEARADRNLISAAFPRLAEQSLRIASENLYKAGSNKNRFTMETESLVTNKPSIMLFSVWK